MILKLWSVHRIEPIVLFYEGEPLAKLESGDMWREIDGGIEIINRDGTMRRVSVCSDER